MNPFLSHRGPTSLRRTWGQRLVLTTNMVLIALSLLLATVLGYANNRAGAVNRVSLDRALTEVDDSGTGQRVLNVLLVGSDSSANLDPDDPVQVGRNGEQFGDVIIIAHLDERSGEVALLSLPRDLWVPLAGSQREGRINQAFLVDGAAGLIETIEENFDIPVHHYVNVDFAGFEGLVEAVGSVEVWFDTAARDWNANAESGPRSQTGFEVTESGCHSLGPRQALAYVRSRYYQTQNADGDWVTDPTSDLGRIRRQQDFLRRLVQEGIDLGARNPMVLADLIDVGIESVTIDQDLTPGILIDLSTTFRSLEPDEIQAYTFPAVDADAGSSRVLLPRIDAAEPLIALFAGAAFDAPETIGVELVYADDLTSDDGLVEEVGDRLAAAGFDVEPTTEDDIAPGLRVLHGPDGVEAARGVAQALELGGARPVGAGGAGAEYTGTIGSQLVQGQAAVGELRNEQAGELGYDVGLVETSSLTGRDVIVEIGNNVDGAVPADTDSVDSTDSAGTGDDAGDREAVAGEELAANVGVGNAGAC